MPGIPRQLDPPGRVQRILGTKWNRDAFWDLGERGYSIADRRTSLQLVDLCVVIERPPMNLEDVRAFR